MDFALSSEQDELVTTVRAVLDKRAGSAAVRSAITAPRGYDADLWRVLCEQVGVAALAIPEEYEGFGATFFETALVLEQLGANLAPSPLLATAIATEALLAGGSADAKAELLPRIAAGEIATVVLADAPVLDADRASIVLAAEGPDLVLVDTPGAGWTETMDQTIRLGRVSSVAGSVVGDGHMARARADTAATAAVAALASGLCRRALDMTVGFAKEREQFGRPIGSFQALKHRMAEMLARSELARSTSWAAAYAVAAHAADADQQAAAAAAYCLEAAAHLAGECIQLHGGIAITWEHDAHLVFKRAHALGRLTGSAADHRRALTI